MIPHCSINRFSAGQGWRVGATHRSASGLVRFIRLAFFSAVAAIGVNQAGAEKTAAGQPITGVQTSGLVAMTSTSSVRVAEPFWLEVIVTAPEASQVAFPSTGKQLGDFDVLEIQDRFDVPAADASDVRTWTRRIRLESIVAGQREIPPLEVRVVNGANSETIRSDAIPVEVISVLEGRGDQAKLRDIQSVVDVPIPSANSGVRLCWALGGATGLALCAIAGLVLARRGRWITPKELALERLDELEQMLVAGSPESEAIALPLSKLMCDYLRMQLAIDDPGFGGDELLRLMESDRRIDSGNLKKLRSLFSLADRVKFGGLQLSPVTLQSVINESRRMIRGIDQETEPGFRRTDKTERL